MTRTLGILIGACVACTAIVAHPTPARADDDPATREQARSEYAAGQAAEKQRDYEGAIAHYDKANELSPHAFNLYNIAVNYEHLGKLRDAVDYYERYLGELPNAPDLAKVTRLIQDLRTRPGTLTVTTIPQGATVVIDGARVGTTPYSHQVRAGRHDVVVELNGRSANDSVVTGYGEPASLVLRLAGQAGSLVVDGNPFGAQISVDDQLVGLVPARVEVAPGAHRVEVSSYGYTSYSITVEITPGQSVPVHARLVHAADGYPPVVGGGDTSGTGGTGTGGTGTPLPAPVVGRFGWLAGVGGGTDISGPGTLLIAEGGYRYNNYSLLLQVGKAGDDTLVAFLIRWNIFPGRVSPYLGFGLVYDYATPDLSATGTTPAAMESQSGVEIEGGLRAALWSTPRYDVALLASVMVRLWKTSDDDDSSDASGTSYPLMLSLEASTK